MPEQFELPVEYKGHQHLFNATLLAFGFTHKFQVDINGHMIIFEPDEEGIYRAVSDPSTAKEPKKIDIELLKEVSGALERIMQ